MKRRKKSTAAPNPKKMFEEAQMVRRVKAYLANMKVITDEERLHGLSVECEPHAGAVAVAAAVPLSASRGRRNPSPTLSTTSSASSTSEGRKSIQGKTFFVQHNYLNKHSSFKKQHLYNSVQLVYSQFTRSDENPVQNYLFLEQDSSHVAVICCV